MKKKKVFYTEAAYFVGTIALAVGALLMQRADFGMSMVVAPSYVLFLKLKESWTWLTFGMTQYLFQTALLILM